MMVRTDRRLWILAAGLAGLAGYVDAIGFLRLGGLFVSFMSGNSTRLAVGLATRSPLWPMAAKLIAAFVTGVMIGSFVSGRTERWRKPALLSLATLLLGAAAMADGIHSDQAVVALLAVAMGVVNCVFQRDREVSIGVTYMTGTLVKLGQHATVALTGGPRLGWLPYLLLWCSLVGGAIAGATLYVRLGNASLWEAVAAAAVLAVVAALLTRDRRRY